MGREDYQQPQCLEGGFYMKKRELACRGFQIKKTIYEDGISCKFDNRRVTVLEEDDGFLFEFRNIDYDYSPPAKCFLVKGKMAVTEMRLTREAAEILMINLAELTGCVIFEGEK